MFTARSVDSSHPLPAYQESSVVALEVLEAGTGGTDTAMWPFALPAIGHGQWQCKDIEPERYCQNTQLFIRNLQRALVYGGIFHVAVSTFDSSDSFQTKSIGNYRKQESHLWCYSGCENREIVFKATEYTQGQSGLVCWS